MRLILQCHATLRKEMYSCFDKACAQKRKSVRDRTTVSGVQLAWLIFCFQARRGLTQENGIKVWTTERNGSEHFLFGHKSENLRKRSRATNRFVKMERPIAVRPVRPNRNGPFHLTFYRNFRNFWHNGKNPKTPQPISAIVLP